MEFLYCYLSIEEKPSLQVFHEGVFVSQFVIKRVINPYGLFGSLGHLIPKGFVLFSLEDPIRFRSVLVGLHSEPETFLKSSSNLKRV